MLREKGLIQDQAQLDGRFDEIDAIARRFGRDEGALLFPAREVDRLVSDGDWDFGPAIRGRARLRVANEDLPEYPEDMRQTSERLLAEHNIDTSKHPPPRSDRARSADSVE
jgi:hypothetical protein